MADQPIPTHLWTKASPAPKTVHILTQLAHFFDQLGDYPKTFKALVKEAKDNGMQLDIAEWEEGIEGGSSVPLLDLYSLWHAKKKSYPQPASVSVDDDDESDDESDDDDADSSDSDSESDDSEDDEEEKAVVDVEAEETSDDGSDAPAPAETSKSSAKRKRDETSESSDDESSDESSSSEDESSEDESDAPPAKKTKIVEASKVEAEETGADSDSSDVSSSSSESESSDDDSSSDDEDSDSSSDSPTPTKAAPAKTAKSSKDKKKPAAKDVKPVEPAGGRSQSSSATLDVSSGAEDLTETPSHVHPSRMSRVPDSGTTPTANSGKKGPVVPFSRIPTDQYVDPRFASNEYVSYDYADKAHRDLIVTKGKGFTKEKNKKKRGSYRGGAIDLTPKGIKFDD